MKSFKHSAPVIGITLDYETSQTYSIMPWYALRENYCTAVSRFGAAPLPLPHELDFVSQYLDMIDGLMITGGAFDVSPDYYGEKTTSDKVSTKDQRTTFEFAITKGAMERKIPILGICGGEQLLNVVLGGTLIQHIPDTIPGALEHEQKNPRTEPGHAVNIVAGTLLHKIASSPSPHAVDGTKPSPSGRGLGEGDFRSVGTSSSPHPRPLPEGEGINPRGLVANVNTAHHQAVAKLAPGTIVNATTSDGVIEGIEFPAHPFCLGVQWHPEYFVDPVDARIMEAFVKAARG